MTGITPSTSSSRDPHAVATFPSLKDRKKRRNALKQREALSTPQEDTLGRNSDDEKSDECLPISGCATGFLSGVISAAQSFKNLFRPEEKKEPSAVSDIDSKTE